MNRKKPKKRKSQAKKASKNIKDKKRQNTFVITIAILAAIIIILGAIILFVQPDYTCPDGNQETGIDTAKTTLTENLLATINGESVYLEEVMVVYNNIPENLKTNDSLQESLNQVVNNKLLLQDAAGKGLSVQEEDVDNAINTFLANSGITLEQLEQNLANSDSSINNFRNDIRNTLLLQLELSDITRNLPKPSEADIRAYYDENKLSFMTLPSAKTKQILIYANETNQEAKLESIKTIASELSATNFCELVSKYSEDTISISRCGSYDFQQGELLPEFEQVVFSSEPGSTKIIQTQLGFHIVQIESVTPSTQLNLEEAREGIKNYLTLINQRFVINNFIINLKEQAEIVSYMK